ncbi:MAG: cytochrome c oxidase subunit II [Steroidobacteraceae bacterium]
MSKIGTYTAAAVAALLASPAFAAWELNMPLGVTELSRDIHHLHMLIFWVCVIIAAVVFGAMIYSLVKFRHSEGAVPARWDHSTNTEIIWTIIPIAVLVGMAVPAAETLIKIEDIRDSELTVKITGYQWKWQYEYVDQKVSFFSTLSREHDRARQLKSGVDVNKIDHYLLDVDRPLVVPANTKVRVLLTGGDVIHAWWVPAFGMKKDAIPGFINELWFNAEKPGIYRGQCAELCGRDHGFMPVVVEVKSKEEYQAWLADQQQSQTPLAQASGTSNGAVATVAAAASTAE